MAAYDYYPAVDEGFNFPPDVREAASRSVELGEAVLDTGTPLGASVAGLVGKGGGLRGVEGVKTVVVAGTLVANVDGTWKIDSSVAGKSRSLNVDSATIVTAFEDGSGKNIRIEFGSAKGTRLVSFVAKLDGGLGLGYGMTVNAATPTSATMSFIQTLGEYDGFIYYNPGTNSWMSNNGEWKINFAGGTLSLEHFLGEVPERFKDILSVSPRGNKFRYNVAPSTAPTSTKGLVLEVRENEPAIDAFIQYDGTKWISTNQDKIWVNGWFGSTKTLELGHVALSGASDDRIAFAQRGPFQPAVSTGSGVLSATKTSLQFWQGGELQDLSTNMRFYIQRGGSTGLAPEPSGDMRFFVRHGGGRRYVGADDAAKKDLTGAAISFVAVVETA